MKKRLHSAGFETSVREDSNGFLISVRKSAHRKFPTLNAVLFLGTLITMFFAPALLPPDFEYFRRAGVFAERLEFTLALMAILLFHEFGHYLAGKRRGVLMSLPYFIPAPNIVGTFGAIIKSKSPFTNRRDLIEVGAAGPIAGFVVSIVALVIGLQNAEIVPPEVLIGFRPGDSLLTRFLGQLIVGPIPEGYDILHSPAAFAGWVGLLVTMINLLPLGQLDGGHIIYGLLGRRQHKIARLFIIFLMILGFWWPGWWFFGVLVFLFGLNHPPTFNDTYKLPLATRIMGIVAVFIFIISFIPAPFMME